LKKKREKKERAIFNILWAYFIAAMTRLLFMGRAGDQKVSRPIENDSEIEMLENIVAASRKAASR
jgi:hypothetical protein